MSEIKESVFGERIDAEFYLPKYLNLDRVINMQGFSLLDDITSKIDVGHVGSMVNEYVRDGIWLLQTKNVKEFFLDETSKIYINTQFHTRLKKSVIKKGNILIARSGSFGTASIYLDDEEVNSSDIIIIDSIDEVINPYYLVTFLNCKYGTTQLLRFASGGLQGHVNLTILEKLKICKLATNIQEYIEQVVKQSYQNKSKSKLLYNQAQTILLFELGLANWQPKHRLTFVKNYADVKQAKRIDAEYFQPKYEEIEDAVKNYSGGYTFVKNEFTQNKSTFIHEDNELYHYVEIGSVDISTSEITPKEVLGANLPANAKRVLKKGDLIISKVRTYRGAIAIVKENGFVGSGAFTILSESGQINKETLFTFLHSKPLLAWSLKPNTGTSYPVIVDKDILNLPIPIFPKGLQIDIQQKVADSIALREQSKHLLECAKRAVEIAIEEDEQTALNWLAKETVGMGV